LENIFAIKYFAGCGSNVSIHQGVRFRGIHLLSIGNNVSVGVDNFIQASGKVTLEDHVMLGPGVKIWSINHKTEDINIPINQQGYEKKEVFLGEGVWLGANVIVLPGVTLPKGCVVSAGSVVGVKAYPEFAIIAGNPARVIGSRLGSEKKTEPMESI
jgi:maltose O-acetyltransferase